MSAAHGARLFFAIEVPEAVRRELNGWARRAARGARVLDADALHLTLLFLGSRPFAEIEELAAALARAAVAAAPPSAELHAACELSLGAPLWLPPRRPRALAVEVHDPSGGLSQLHAALLVEAAAEQSQPGGGGEAAPRSGRAQRFRPHITVARASAGAGARVPRDFPEPTPQLEFAAGRAVLYRSFLEPAGARYEALAGVELALAR